jgi:hypothetical protein
MDNFRYKKNAPIAQTMREASVQTLTCYFYLWLGQLSTQVQIIGKPKKQPLSEPLCKGWDSLMVLMMFLFLIVFKFIVQKLTSLRKPFSGLNIKNYTINHQITTLMLNSVPKREIKYLKETTCLKNLT